MKRRDFVRMASASLGLAPAMRAAEGLGAPPTSAQAIRFGYAAITWGGNDRQAIEDVASLGFPGIQLRSNILPEFGDKPAALKELLQAHDLKMVALSSGGVSVTTPPAEEFVKHERHAAFVRAVGGMYLQVTDQLPQGRPATAADRRTLGERMTEIGKRTADIGIPLGYHNHMNSLGERPGEIDEILAAADARYVRLELDVAHYTQGGGDPVKAIDRYHDRLLFLHLKDVEPVPPAAGADPARSYRWVELGRGRVDLPGVFAALKKAGFKGWAVVELDAVPDKTRTPKDSGQISKSYLEKQGFRIEDGGRA
ncbi:MAG: xylose isomerase [Acidobacteria bacterium]|nr:MAG: xylose isomerase [Acidobacteriota bacterium]